ncbi:hypothetical protein [Sphaerisporangium dianthi]|uniref:Uncharacterized protein n=1 Tax=Sphaerisporangium dianthi TaxID=1436120 RepID=A0ABV9C8N0_9ACTN
MPRTESPVYVITDAAAPPRTALPIRPAVPLSVRLSVRAAAVMAVLALLHVAVPVYGCGWWLYGVALVWVVWPVLRPVRRIAGHVLGAADALIAAALGTRRLAYLAVLLRQAVRDPHTPAPAPAREASCPRKENRP